MGRLMSFDLVGMGSWLLQVIAVYGAAVLTFIGIAPTKLGERLLSHHLERKLSAFKHEQNEKLEALKAQLAHLGDRGQRSNQREFDAISAVWDRFVEAFLSTNTGVIAFIEYPDLEKLDSDELSTFLDSTELSEGQKKQVVEAANRNSIYCRVVTFRYLNRAQADIFDARLLLRKNGIFVPDDLSRQFKSALELLSAAQVEKYMELRHAGRHDGKETLRFLDSGERIFGELLAAVRTRLLRE
jgi:hypothetical protein